MEKVQVRRSVSHQDSAGGREDSSQGQDLVYRGFPHTAQKLDVVCRCLSAAALWTVCLSVPMRPLLWYSIFMTSDFIRLTNIR